ncbi:cupin [Microbacterium panaciterrae]|uniref:Cupin domain-containing protein n=1 Tax=Microbacterium panaciterrae TaxID=985759 RepID=A0ABP8PIR6_9MICO
MMSAFPGGTSLSFLDVYGDEAPDHVCGGSPHVHLASTECYIGVGGRGQLHTLTSEGVSAVDIEPGSLVWFTPGTIHRAVNLGELRVIVLMSNSGLPEAGDAVLTFPAEYLQDPERYEAAAALASDGTEQERAVAAARRRDLAVAGYLPIRDALAAGDTGPLEEFRAAAAALVRARASEWADIVRTGPAAQADETFSALQQLAAGDASFLADAAVAAAPDPTRRFGMCGRLLAYDLTSR